MPKVSVIVPNYNHASYLERRLDSVIQQTLRDIEILILDDCSKDHSREIIQRYAGQDMRVKFFFNETNSGSTFKQWNKGVGLCSGNYVWIAESDDFADLAFLEKTIAVMEHNPEVCMVFSNSHIINSDGSIIDSYQNWVKPVNDQKWMQDYISKGKQESIDYLMYRNIIPNASAILIRRSAYVETKGALEDMKLCGDWLLYLQMLKQGDIAYLSASLNYYRVHNETLRNKYFYSINGFEEIMQVFQTAMEWYNLKKEDINKDKFAYITSIWLQSLSNSGIDIGLIKKHFKYYQFIKDLDIGLNKKILLLYIKKLKNSLSIF